MRPVLVALLLTVELAAAVVAAAVWLDTPAPPSSGRAARGALVLRDDVSPFEELGSELFTRGTFVGVYAEVVYLTRHDGAPSETDVLAALDALAARRGAVDVYLLQHGHRWRLRRVLEATLPLGLVYSTGCGDLVEVTTAGSATALVGHTGARSMSPLFYVYFARALRRGASVEAATDLANTRYAALARAVERVLGKSRFYAPITIAHTHATVVGEGAFAPLGSAAPP